MDAAEAIFCERGYESTTIRAISSRSGLNLGTVVYHWGTKERLFRAVCERRFAPIKAEQIRRISALERAAARGDTIGLEPIIRAFIEPPMLMHDSPSEAERIRLLYGRLLADPCAVTATIARELLSDGETKFRRLVEREVPQIAPDRFLPRYVCALGAFIFAHSFGDRAAESISPHHAPIEWPTIIEEIVAFMCAGLLRPS